MLIQFTYSKALLCSEMLIQYLSAHSQPAALQTCKAKHINRPLQCLQDPPRCLPAEKLPKTFFAPANHIMLQPWLRDYVILLTYGRLLQMRLETWRQF
nr:hypothetical protein Iba_chr05dCG12530 [Ipomoea batatas]